MNNAPENYIVLARRARPQSFAELVGQDVVSSAIQGMLSHKKISHAFLFTGTRGTGKTSSARILAKSLCCEQGPTITPCQKCVHCIQITACAHDDVLEIDGASHTGVDNIRELREATRFYPTSARYKIFIIDEVHMLSTGAFNALLKTLEEPPPQVIFILATTELHKVPVTVRSRCMIFSFKKIEAEVIAQHLKNILVKESVTFEDDALIIIAREAKGSLRDSLSLLEQTIAFCGGSGFSKHISVNDVKKSLCLQGEEVAENIFAAICEKNAGKALEFLHQADLASLDLAQLIENCAQLFRQSLLIKTISEKEKVLKITQLLPKEYDFLHKVTLNLTSTALSEIFRLLANSVKEISRTSAGLSVAEIIVIDCISRADWLSSTEILSFFSQRGNDVASRKPALDEAGGATCTLARSASTAKTVEVSTGDVATKSVQVFEKLKIDLNAFKKLIAAAEKRSQTLAARLNFAKIDFFNKDLIQFSDVSENETYLSLNEKDLSLYWECIHEIKMEHAQFKGVFTPKPSLKTNPASQSVSANIKNMIESAQKFAPKARNDVAQKQDISLETGKISLSDIKNKEKNQEFEEKEKSILGKEHIKQVQKLATEIQLIALK